MKQIAIYGASGFGSEVHWLIETCAESGMAYQIVCFIDDDPEKHGKFLNGTLIMGLEEAIRRYPNAFVASGIGVPKIREKVVNKATSVKCAFVTIIHPRVEFSRLVEIGEGTIICAGSILTTNIRIGKQVQLNLNCTIGHDVVMGDYTTLAPGVNVSGWVHFGKRVYVGTGAVFINGTKENPLIIGDDVTIGAGASVLKSIFHGTWAGVPAQPLHK